MSFWLFKTEPEEYSIEDLQANADGFEPWNGIRNYQARNLMRDQIKLNDLVFIYHSSCKNVGIAGIAKIVREAYSDPAQFAPENKYFDSASRPEQPKWYCVDVKFERKFTKIIPLSVIKTNNKLNDMVLVKQGRLSIQPVTEQQWQTIINLAV